METFHGKLAGDLVQKGCQQKYSVLERDAGLAICFKIN